MKSIQLTEELYAYVRRHQPDLHPCLEDLRQETARREDAGMQISPDQGVFMHQLAHSLGARRILEVGCFTGYSAVCLALALPAEGRLISCDINPETTAIARRYLDLAGVGPKAEIRLGPAVETIAHLVESFGPESFDLAFIDADKENYQRYYEGALRLVRRGGMILVDNVLWSGKVLDEADRSPSTVAIREFNELVRKDSRVQGSILTIADGLYLLRKL